MSSWTLDFIDDMERMRKEIDRVLGGVRPSDWTFPFSRISFLPGHAARAYPLMNIGEDSNNYYVHALAPGVDPKTLNVSATGSQLTISGEKQALPEGINPDDIHRSERATGKFTRGITLESDLDCDKITAGYSDGLLQITLPKAEAAKPRSIKVKMG